MMGSMDRRAAASLMLLLAGCKPAAVGGGETLTVWLAADYASAALYQDLDREFEAAHPGVQVKLLGVPWEDMPTKVKTAIIGGKPPDVAHQHPFSLGAQGFAEPLDAEWQAWGDEPAFMPGAMEDATWGGKRYGVPLDINCTVLVYNRAQLKAAGVPEPGAGYAMAQWRDDLKKLTQGDHYGLGLSTGAWHTFAFIRANGGEVLKQEGGKMVATFTDPKSVEAIAFLSGLGAKDHVGPTPSTKQKDYEDASTLFTAGKVAMIYTGPWDFASIRKNAPGLDFGVTTFPAGLDGQQRGSVQGGGGLFVPKGAAHKALAFAWMKLATSEKYALRLAKEQGRFPVRQALYADPFFKQDAAIATFVQALPGARPYKLDAYPQANQAFMDAVKACFYGADPQTELAKAQRVAQLAIDAVEGQ
ncbi:MAG: hypothetical protein JWM80_1468 [Cyanobacteria bacterium RYN_339]|nr:hypothetical protein [Cyanobacteria bacterium RYN_339]